MKKKLLSLALCFSLALSLCPITTPTEVARAEEMELVEEGYYDQNIIPDRYNTGCDESVGLTVVDLSVSTTVNGLTLKSANGGNANLLGFQYNNTNAPSEIVFENYDFSNKDFWMTQYGEGNRRVKFINCKFGKITYDPCVERERRIVEVEFINCTIRQFQGADATFDRCKFGGSYSDGVNPFYDVTIKNSYFGDYAQTNDEGVHTDAFQIYGRENIPAENIIVKNCRIEIPAIRSASEGKLNAALMLQMKYSNGENFLFEDCIINGGGYSIYAGNYGECVTENVIFRNISVGHAHLYGDIYPSISDGITFENLKDTDNLYIGSVWKDDVGRTHLSVSNDTAVDKELIVVTDSGAETFTLECMATAVANGATTTEEIPYDVDIVLADTDAQYVVCYDSSVSAENQIRFVNWSGAPVYRSASPSQGGNSVNSNDGPFVEESTSINMTMITTEVNVIVPLNISCVINPNEVVDFTHGDLVVTNNSYVPVKVSLSMFDVVDDTKTMLRPNDIANIEEGLTWNCLNEEQSNTYISVGILAEEENGWKSILANDYAYAGFVDDKFPLGIVGAKESANLALKSHHGNSFKEAAELKLQIGFVAELALD